MSCKPHIGDVGTIFTSTIVDCKRAAIDISTATTLEMIFEKYDASQTTVTAVFVTDGTDGKIKHVTLPGFFDVEGVWRMQSHVITPAGEWHSDIDTFEVLGNL